MRSNVYLMDCMEGMAGTPNGFYDLAIVDPPYGIEVNKMAYTQAEGRNAVQKNGARLMVRRSKYAHGNWDSVPPPPEYFTELRRVSKAQIIWGVNYMDTLLPGGRIVWDKCVPDGVSFSSAEIAFCSLHNGVKLFRYMWAGMMQAKSLGEPTTQQGNKKLNEKRIHPTQKPVELYRFLLNQYATPGARILDTHLGSGSHRIAAHDLGMDFTAYEIDPVYFSDSEKWFKNRTAQQRIFQP